MEPERNQNVEPDSCLEPEHAYMVVDIPELGEQIAKVEDESKSSVQYNRKT